MVRRYRHRTVVAAAALVACLCCGKAAAAAGSFGGGVAMASPGDQARRIKEEATALHRAGQYEEAAEEFARAAQLLEEAGVGLAPPPALSAIRLSLAASQLKSGDLRGAEATCSQLLKTPGLPRPLRQKASYRRGMSRKRQAEAAGAGAAGSRLAQRAYRDAYLSVELSNDGGAAGPAAGDAKALGLMAEMEAGDWGQGWLTEADRSAARSKADKHLTALASMAPPARSTPAGSGGLFDMFGGGGGSGAPGFPDLGSGAGAGGALGGMPGLMDMMGAGTGGVGGGAEEGMGGLMSMLMGGGGAKSGLGGGADGPDPKQMLKMAKKMSKGVKKQLRNPGTQQMVCAFLNQAKPETLMSLATTAGFPGANEAIVNGLSGYLQKADGKTLESWIDYGEIATCAFRRLKQFSVLWSRGIALAGIWLVWVWVRACFAPIVVQKA
ncbi:expressed unknown protein [Ectocarpus siliculosus]|uniref:Uncharacterized protein n=1 Tax=Ectocarpus siliculosus TaxID=2880 RepID=D8LD29_ECTSI|nr:expressed unknown protein [Ectocarpus siliculosus]|eukprot:CBN78396.1 expressed unknown protein [Ectocarpus siliculosus]